MCTHSNSNVCHLVVELGLDPAGVDDVLDAGDGEGGLGNVGGHHAQAAPYRRRAEDPAPIYHHTRVFSY
jgi:hypothetical protein